MTKKQKKIEKELIKEEFIFYRYPRNKKEYDTNERLDLFLSDKAIQIIKFEPEQIQVTPEKWRITIWAIGDIAKYK